jgi:anaerobic selenocysteine-containing dehydrogenase
MMTNENQKQVEETEEEESSLIMSRRTFVKLAGAASVGVAALGYLSFSPSKLMTAQAEPDPVLTDPTDYKYSICLMCHSGCGIRCKVKDGTLIKIDGNPYHPNSLEPHISYDTSPTDALNSVGTVCAKGHSGIQQLYDPYRIKQPLKRVGPRGSGIFEAITWTTLFSELVSGGTLPGAKAGETSYTFDGLSALYGYETESNVIAAYEAARVAAGVGGSIADLKDFCAMIQADRDLIVAQLDPVVAGKLIDPNNPNFGPKSNQVIHMIGRAEHGRKEFTDRFWGDYFGTNNKRNEHTDICELPRHDATALIRKKTKAPADYLKAEYVMFFGSSRLEAGFPFQAAARKVIRGINDGNLKIAVVDPRFSVTAAKAETWVPLIPGTDGALAMGMIRHIIETKLAMITPYLQNTNYDAAIADNEDTWADATYLVRDDTREFLTPADAGLPAIPNTTGKYVVWDSTAYQAVVDPDDPSLKGKLQCASDHADIEHTGSPNGIPCKSAFTLLKESAVLKTLAEYATICGLTQLDIENLANEFTNHGKKAIAEYYRGVAQHTNGLPSALAIGTLNTIIGNSDHEGGIMYGGHNWYEFGEGKTGSRINLKDSSTKPGKISSWGLRMSRGGAKYEDTTEFTDNGYPASHVYFPVQAATGHAKNLSHSCMEGILDQYPYPAKAVFATKANFNYSMPAMKGVIEEGFSDSSVVPLFVAFDIVIGEFSSFADYILPDGCYLEQWATPHYYYNILTKGSGVRQPVVNPISPDIKLVEDVYIQLGKDLGYAGYGTDGFGSAGDNLNSAVDWYHHCAENVGGQARDAGVPGIASFAVDDWDGMRNYVLARGGVFEDVSKSYDPDGKPHHKWKYKTSPFHIYAQGLGTAKHYFDGTYFSGVGTWMAPEDSGRNSIDDAGYPFHLITYKSAQHTQSRTAALPWLMSVQGENYIEINTSDADGLGITDGEEIRLVSMTNQGGIVGKAKLTEGIRPGVVAISHSLGHWQYGSRANVIDGAKTGFDNKRSGGISANPVMRMDSYGGGKSGLRDSVGGGLVFFDTKVKIVRS